MILNYREFSVVSLKAKNFLRNIRLGATVEFDNSALMKNMK
jgi:hypothetical protein